MLLFGVTNLKDKYYMVCILIWINLLVYIITDKLIISAHYFTENKMEQYGCAFEIQVISLTHGQANVINSNDQLIEEEITESLNHFTLAH